MRIFQQTGRTDSYRRLHHIKESEEIFHQTVGQLGTKKSLQYRIIIRITQRHLVQAIGIHEFIKDICTKHHRFRNNHRCILKLVKFRMALYHIVYKSQTTSFTPQ